MRFFFLRLALFLFSFLVGSQSLLAQKRYNVEFRDANIKNVVRLLAKMNNQNVVVTDKVSGTVTASFENIRLEDAINAILATHGYGVIIEHDIMQVLTAPELATLGKDLETKSISLRYAKSEDVLDHVQQLVSTRGAVVADERTNSLHIRDTKSALQGVRDLVSKLDSKDRQVLIEAKIIEASLDFIHSLGIQWGVTKSGGKVSVSGLNVVGTGDSGRNLIFNAAGQGASGGAPTSGIGLILGSFGGGLGDVQLSAAEANGEIAILSRPSIVTINNHPAEIRSGSTFYVRTTTESSASSGSSGSVAAQLEQIETGIELKVTPQITVGDNVKLTIEATESEADFTRAIEGIPAVIDSTATTTVILKDGETTIIGGLFKVRDARSVKGTPGLMRIPIFGHLFKSKTKSKLRSELLIFITPQVISGKFQKLPHFAEPESRHQRQEARMKKNEQEGKKKEKKRRKKKWRRN